MDINDAFKSTYRLIFGECNLELDDLAPYLLKFQIPVNEQKSFLSGKQVALSMRQYAPGSKFISADEIDMNRKYALDINEIKDLDSIIEAIQDRAQYAGNKVFGNSKNVENSDNVIDSHYVKNSYGVLSCKYAAYSSHIRDNSEYVFGCAYFLNSKFLINVIGADSLTRAFEAHLCVKSSDLFFCSGCMTCNHVMFSFNLRSKKYCIGNLELPQDKYFSLRKKLVDESREYMETHKDFYSMFENLPPAKPPKIEMPPIAKKNMDYGKIEDAFKATCRIIFGTELPGKMTDYEEYWHEFVEKVEKQRTPYGNEITHADVYDFGRTPHDRRVLIEEAEQLAKIPAEITDGMRLEEVIKALKTITFFRTEFHEGNNGNNIDTFMAYYAVNTYQAVDATHAKNCAYDTLALNSEYIFGSYRALHSKFCIRCQDVANLSACFEMSDCSNCSNSMFCHNCEGLSDCLFCFNAKSLKYAVGNVEVGRDEYSRVRKLVCREIVAKLGKNKRLDANIFNIGAWKSKKE